MGLMGRRSNRVSESLREPVEPGRKNPGTRLCLRLHNESKQCNLLARAYVERKTTRVGGAQYRRGRLPYLFSPGRNDPLMSYVRPYLGAALAAALLLVLLALATRAGQSPATLPTPEHEAGSGVLESSPKPGTAVETVPPGNPVPGCPDIPIPWQLGDLAPRFQLSPREARELMEAGAYRTLTVRGPQEEELVRREIRVFRSGDAGEILRILAHEMGHALGLPHVEEPGFIMSPAYGAWEGVPRVHPQSLERLEGCLSASTRATRTPRTAPEIP